MLTLHTHRRRTEERARNRNRAKGHTKQGRGKANEAFGRQTDDKRLEYRGKATHAAGTVQALTGDLEDSM